MTDRGLKTLMIQTRRINTHLKLTGNSLTIFVMLRKPFRKMSVSVVLICLALSDTVVGLMLPFNKMFIRNMIGYDVRALSLVGCKTYFWAWRLFKVRHLKLWFFFSSSTFPPHLQEHPGTSHAILPMTDTVIQNYFP